MAETIFSKIVRGDIPAHIIYEDEHTMAFLDINPVSEGHTLVISKEPIDRLEDCSLELYDAIFRTVRKISLLVKDKLQPQRVGVVVYGFDVPHVHVHVLPLYREGQIKLADRPETAPDQENLKKVAKKLRK